MKKISEIYQIIEHIMYSDRYWKFVYLKTERSLYLCYAIDNIGEIFYSIMSRLSRKTLGVIAYIAWFIVVSASFFVFQYQASATAVLPTTYSLSGKVVWPTPWHFSGNAGSVSFLPLTESLLTPRLDSTGFIHWAFWTENLGWISFDHGVLAVTLPYVYCPADVLSGWLTCDVAGYAWSHTAWWIHLGGDGSIDAISDLRYDPDTRYMNGFAYSQGVGWIPLEGIQLVEVNRGFQWRAYVIGNISGKRTYDTAYNSITDSFDTKSFSAFLNTIRKRVIELGRWYSDSNTTLNYKILYNTDYIVPDSGWESNNIRSYIVIWGDIIIEGAILQNPSYPVALIALKWPGWVGGNIYIKDDIGWALPDTIYASLIAEWAVISGEKNSITGLPDFYIDHSLLNVPVNQLYVNGTIISRNTIGWAARGTPVCPVFVDNCNPLLARRFDFNHFRNFVAGSALYNLTHRAYTKVPYLDGYSFVAEYDSRMLIDPPPGLDLYEFKKNE